MDDFCAEAEEILESLDRDIVKLENHPGDRDVINSIFRSMHTLKGSSGIINYKKLNVIAHRTEDLFDEIRQGKRSVTPPLVNAILASIDVLRKLVAAARRRDDASSIAASACLASLRQAAEESSEEAGAAPDAGLPTPDTATAPAPESKAAAGQQSLRVAIEKLDKAMNLVGELVINQGGYVQELHNMRNLLPEMDRLVSRLRLSIRHLFEPETTEDLRRKIELMARQAAPAGATREHGLDFARAVNEEMTAFIARSLGAAGSGDAGGIEAITQDYERVKSVLEELLVDLDHSADYIGQITGELQQAMMRTRMVPVSQLFNRYPRLVRDLARNVGKKVDLTVSGEETEMDKAMVEDLADPLMHIIRNSLDHGIERPEARLEKGKPEEGRLFIAAYYEGSQAVIEITDDGAGIDPAAIRDAAIAKKLVTESETATMTDDDLVNLIFLPGFSTAREVSELSGRGVGMDVVKNNVTRLKGMIELRSIPGEGTTIRIRLPLTLAIIQTLLVRVRNEVFALPLFTVEETIHLELAHVRRVGDREVFNLRENVLPLIRLDQALSLSEETLRGSSYLPVVIVSTGQKRVGLMVDQLLGKKEIVIKALGSLLKRVPFVSGSTIMGDGSVILILDVPEIVEQLGRAALRVVPGSARNDSSGERKGRALIVDDSLTVRKGVAKMLTEDGFEVTTAEDGAEALQRAKEGTYDVVLVDIVMPKMDGYKVVEELRKLKSYKETPVFIVSAKGQKLDKKRGFDVGADEYIVKPIEKSLLVRTIAKYLGRQAVGE